MHGICPFIGFVMPESGPDTALVTSQGVRDVTFSNDGRRFVSTGYDKVIRVWDTETGSVIRTLNTGKVSCRVGVGVST